MKNVRWLAVMALIGCMSRETRDDDAVTAAAEEKESMNTQAVKGAALYTQHCAKCHGVMGEGTKKGPRVVDMDKGALSLNPPANAQKRTMQFRTVGDVAEFVLANMPKDDPGKLSEEDYFRILAFDLKANGVKLGNQHLDMNLARTMEIPREADQPASQGQPVSRR